MNLKHLGRTRTAVRSNYALLTPDTFVRAPLPGMENATAIVHASPALGAAFVQYTAEIGPSGCLGPATMQRFLYVLEGDVTVKAGRKNVRLAAGGFAFLPVGFPHHVISKGAARVAVIEKPHVALDGAAAPEPLFGEEANIAPQSLLGDDGVQVRPLIPAEPAFDLAVNTMTYAPGSTLPIVETHVMEHGLVMLGGGGIYRLGDDWLTVTQGDFIWMGPYCPQWFGALGKTPARYLIYKDWNRHPGR
jgi:(S)-ureidoglycine aminohydrolase